MKVRFFSMMMTMMIMAVVSTVNAQQVTFDDLVNGNDASLIEKSASKKWVRDFNASENVDLAREVIKTEFLKLGKSKHWISLASSGELTNELSYQTGKKMYVDRMIADLKAAGFTLSSSKISDDTRTYVYSKGDIKVEVLALATETTSSAAYLVTLL